MVLVMKGVKGKGEPVSAVGGELAIGDELVKKFGLAVIVHGRHCLEKLVVQCRLLLYGMLLRVGLYILRDSEPCSLLAFWLAQKY